MPTQTRKMGYVRTSTKHQNESRQIDALLAYGVEKRDIFIDAASGKDFDRPAYLQMKKLLCPGDELVLLDLDRLGRNYSQIAEEYREITKIIGCDIVILNCPVLSTKREDGSLDARLIADIMFNLLSYVSERERESIKRRQKEGITSAKARGVRFGRPKIAKPDEFDDFYKKVLMKQMTAKEAMRLLNLKPNKFYDFVDEFRKENGLA